MDKFGYRLESKFFGKVDDRFHDSFGMGVTVDVADQAAVDLDIVDIEF